MRAFSSTYPLVQLNGSRVPQVASYSMPPNGTAPPVTTFSRISGELNISGGHWLVLDAVSLIVLAYNVDFKVDGLGRITSVVSWLERYDQPLTELQMIESNEAHGADTYMEWTKYEQLVLPLVIRTLDGLVIRSVFTTNDTNPTASPQPGDVTQDYLPNLGAPGLRPSQLQLIGREVSEDEAHRLGVGTLIN